MGSSIFATIIILTTIFIILSSLGFGLFYLLCDGNGSKRTMYALSVRIVLSMGLFLGLLLAVYNGWIIPSPPPL
jgi:Trk-type K+ transport system membrane component